MSDDKKQSKALDVTSRALALSNAKETVGTIQLIREAMARWGIGSASPEEALRIIARLVEMPDVVLEEAIERDFRKYLDA